MEIENKKIILFDMDMTLVDSSIAKQYCKNYKEVQKHISEFSLYEGIKESIDKLAEQHTIYIVSGNVGSTVKKVIQHFNLNITLENVYGYRQGYPMENLARKIKVMQVAIDAILQSLQITKSDLLYIGWKNRSRLGQCAGADWDTFDAAKLMIFSETVAF